MKMKLTVGQLKEIIKNEPDDLEVMVLYPLKKGERPIIAENVEAGMLRFQDDDPVLGIVVS
jgi:hypothetical protein